MTEECYKKFTEENPGLEEYLDNKSDNSFLVTEKFNIPLPILKDLFLYRQGVLFQKGLREIDQFHVAEKKEFARNSIIKVVSLIDPPKPEEVTQYFLWERSGKLLPDRYKDLIIRVNYRNEEYKDVMARIGEKLKDLYTKAIYDKLYIFTVFQISEDNIEYLIKELDSAAGQFFFNPVAIVRYINAIIPSTYLEDSALSVNRTSGELDILSSTLGKEGGKIRDTLGLTKDEIWIGTEEELLAMFRLFNAKTADIHIEENEETLLIQFKNGEIKTWIQ